MFMTLSAVLAVSLSGSPTACNADRAIAVAKRAAIHRMVRATPLDAYRVVGPVQWGQLVAAFPEYRELEMPKEKVGELAFFVVGVGPHHEPKDRPRASPKSPKIYVGGGFEIFVDAETCTVLALLEEA